MTVRLLLISCVLATASPAFASVTVVVLGIRSVEGDDELANDLTEQLRGASKAVSGWTVSRAAVSMEQMTLAHGCDDIDAACLSKIAKGLQVERVIYGTIRRNSARADYDFAVTISLYDADTEQIVREVSDTIRQKQTDFGALTARADKLMKRLTSKNPGGAIAVHVNIPDADVSLNGQPAGTAHAGSLRLDNLPAGQYRVEVSRDGYSSSVTTVGVSAGGEAAIEATLVSTTAVASSSLPAEESNSQHQGHNLNWLGWTLIGVGGASAAGWVASLLVIKDVNDSSLYARYRTAVANGNKKALAAGDVYSIIKDSCAAATDHGLAYDLTDAKFQQVVSMCHNAMTFQVLQWVFLSTAVAASASGAILLMTASDEWDKPESKRQPPVFALSPDFGPHSGYVNATLRF